MAITRQSGTQAFTGAGPHSVTVSSYDATRAYLRYSMRNDGANNAWDDQCVARKDDATHLEFERSGTTGTWTVYWELIQCDDNEFSVQDIDDLGPFASTTYEDYTITPVPQGRSFCDASFKMVGNRDDNTHARVYFIDDETVRVDANASASADLEWFVQVVTIDPGCNPLVEQVLVEDSDSSEDISLARTFDPDRAFVVGTSTWDATGDWENDEMHSIRLATDGASLEMPRTDSTTGQAVDAAVFVVQADCFSVQHATLTVADGAGVGDDDETQSFTAPGDASQAFVLGGAYYNQSQFGTDGAGDGPDSNGFTLTPNSGRTSVVARRNVGDGEATIPIQLVEVVPLGDVVQIALDSLVDGFGDTPPSLTIDTALTNKIAIVITSDEGTDEPTGVTLGGEAMTKVVSATATQGFGNTTTMWALLDADLPSGGGPHAVAASGGTFNSDTRVVSFYIHNADQTIPSGGAIATDISDTAESSMSATATAPSAQSIGIGVASHGDIDLFGQWATGTGEWTRTFHNIQGGEGHELVVANQLFTSSGSKTYTETADGSWNRGTMLEALFAQVVTEVDFAGAFDGAATFTGALNPVRGFDTAFDGAATFDGALAIDTALDATFDGATVFTGDFSAQRGFDTAFDGAATFTGALVVDTVLDAAFDGAATFTGALAIDTVLAGAFDGATVFVGDFNVAGDISMASTFDGSTVFDGALAIDTVLDAAFDGATVFTGVLNPVRSFDSSFDGATVFTGVLNPVRGFDTAFDGAATFTGSLAIDTALDAAFDGAATFDGALATDTVFDTAFDGATVLDATLNPVRSFDGSFDGAATFDGELAVDTVFDTAFDGATVFAGDLDLSGDITFVGVFDGAATFDGELAVDTVLAGAFDGATVLDATLNPVRGFDTVFDGVAVFDGDLNVVRGFASTFDGAATFDGELAVDTVLAGAFDGATVFAGDLDLVEPFTDLSAAFDGTTELYALLVEGAVLVGPRVELTSPLVPSLFFGKDLPLN